MRERNPANQKRAVDSNTPSDNTSYAHDLFLLEKASSLLNQEEGEKALRVLGSINVMRLPRVCRADYFEKTGEAFQLTGRFSKAFTAFRSGLRCFASLNDLIGQATINHKLGDVCRQMEKFLEAENYYRAAMRTSKKIKNPFAATFHTDALCGVALAYRGRGKYAQALQLFRRCETKFSALNDKQGLAYVLWATGTTCRFFGRLKLAERHLRRSLRIYSDLKDTGGVAYAKCGLGGTLRIRGKARESFGLYKEAFGIFSRLGDRFGKAYALCGQGNALRMQNDWRRSIPFFNKAIRLYQSISQKGPRAFVLWNLSQSHLALGNIIKANRLLSTAKRLFRQVRDERGLVYILIGKGEAERIAGSKSVYYFRQAQIQAAKHHLPLEHLYARQRIAGLPLKGPFKKVGVDWSSFQNYQFIP